jgi:hypothetical protein
MGIVLAAKATITIGRIDPAFDVTGDVDAAMCHSGVPRWRASSAGLERCRARRISRSAASAGRCRSHHGS